METIQKIKLPPSVKSEKRNATIDVIRIFAALGVIAIHVPFHTPEARLFQDVFSPLCVPFFYLTSLVLMVSGMEPATVPGILKKSLLRIGLPFLAWSFIYAGLLWAKSTLTGADNNLVLWRVLLFGESAVHLYFLPSLLNIQLLVVGVFMISYSAFSQKLLGFLFVSLSICYLVLGAIVNSYGVASAPHIIFYVVAAFLLASKTNRSGFHGPLVAAGIFLVGLSVFNMIFKIHAPVAASVVNLPIGGLGLLLLAIGLPLRKVPGWVKVLSSLTFGIYLCHVVFLEAFQFFFKGALSVELHYNLIVKLLVCALVFALSALFAFLIRKNFLLRIILLGETK
ncbi:acyltransferase [Paraflavisolibacter sp. H34]|uniref:acyltransferase n=1 Tax=Huijunlia imazamoxiresistens TaxID=3127457 RepID=UPI0030177AAB